MLYSRKENSICFCWNWLMNLLRYWASKICLIFRQQLQINRFLIENFHLKNNNLSSPPHYKKLFLYLYIMYWTEVYDNLHMRNKSVLSCGLSLKLKYLNITKKLLSGCGVVGQLLYFCQKHTSTKSQKTIWPPAAFKIH